jgi:hypothetical protein
MTTDPHASRHDLHIECPKQLHASSSSQHIRLESRIIDFEQINCGSSSGFSNLLAAVLGDVFRTVAALEESAIEEFQQTPTYLPVENRPQLRKYLAALHGLRRIAQSELDRTVISRDGIGLRAKLL